MITLTEDLRIGKGVEKIAYFHPSDPNICVKIIYSKAKEAAKVIARELQMSTKIQESHPEVKGLSLFYGTEETNFGLGYKYELIRDYDGVMSQTLEEYLESFDAADENELAKLKDALETLRERMLDFGIIPMAMYPRNIMVRKLSPDDFELVIIDDIGSAVLIPLEYYFKLVADKRIKRHFKRMIEFLKGMRTEQEYVDFFDAYVKELK
ncbi:MAG: YrbL family protein [Phascolarctobacterium sp.]|nr:YrbL family protein [Phascolarctobacterium sp.]